MTDNKRTADQSGSDTELRWARAAAWAREQSFGPYAHGVDEPEARRIEALRDRILEVGEETAWREYDVLTRTDDVNLHIILQDFLDEGLIEVRGGETAARSMFWRRRAGGSTRSTMDLNRQSDLAAPTSSRSRVPRLDISIPLAS
jgi:hypothetical protein